MVRGPSLATGYWCRDAATRAAFVASGCAPATSTRRSADGYWTFLGRNNDMIKAGGIWVSPAEVESVLVEHPDVLEAAVVGGRDADGLEITVAFLVPRSGHEIDAAGIDAHCRAGWRRSSAPAASRWSTSYPRRPRARSGASPCARGGAWGGGEGGCARGPARGGAPPPPPSPHLDVHTHAEVSARTGRGRWPLELEHAVDEYFGIRDRQRPTVEQMAAYYRERKMMAVVFTVDATTAMGVPPVPNDEIAEAALPTPTCSSPSAASTPTWAAAVREVHRLVDEQRVRGFKFHPTVQAFHPNDRMAYPVYEGNRRARADRTVPHRPDRHRRQGCPAAPACA